MKIRFSPDSISREELAKLKKVQPDQLSSTAVDKHLFKYKAYKKQLEKDLIKAKKFMAEDPEASLEFYLSVEYDYTDKETMPLLVVGKVAGQWKKFLKDRILQHKTTDAVGLLRFDDSKKGETGLSYLELTIEKGKPKQKVIKKLIDKWLMPSGLEISFGGEDIEEEIVPEVENQPDLAVELDANDRVQGLFLAWKAGKYAGKEEQKIRLKIKTYLDKWQEKYTALDEAQQAKVQIRKQQHDYMLDELDRYEAPEAAASDSPGITGIVLEGGDGKTTLSRINIAGFGLDAPGKIDQLKKTNYSKLYAALESFNKEKDLERKRKLFDGALSMIEKWVAHHKKDKVSTDKTKQQLRGLEDIFQAYQGFMTNYEGARLDTSHQSTHQDSQGLTGTKTLFDATAGNKKSSEQAKDVRDATVDDRAVRLAQFLQRGKASDDDKTFGAVMKWMADNIYEELEGKYILATQQEFNKKSTLVSDVISVFGVGSLRTRYLLDKLKGEESSYAKLAFALGLMGNTWLRTVVTLGTSDTIEREDAMGLIIKGYSAEAIQELLDSEASKSTFEGAIAQYLRDKHPNMRRQIEAHLGVQKARETDNPEELNRANDAYLTSTINRLRKEGTLGKKLDKCLLLQEITRWLENASDEERAAMLSERSNFMTTLTDMSGTFSYSGIDKGDLAFIKEKLSAPKDLPDNKKTNVAFDHLKALAEQQSTKNFISRWKQDKDIGKQFQAVLFDADIKDPQKAAVAKFCSDDQFQRWQAIDEELAKGVAQDQEKILNEERDAIFKVAHDGVQGLMDRAQVNYDIQKEIIETLYSNGAKGAVYQELVGMAKGRIPVVNFGKDVRLVLAKLDPDDKQLAAIKADKELMELLQAKVLGRMGLKSNQKQWTVIVKKLGLQPPLSEVTLKSEQLEQQRDVDRFKDKRRENRVNRAKLQNKEELAKQAADTAEQEKRPEYWAARLITAYKSSRLTTDDHVLLQLSYEAQKKGVALDAVLTELKELSASTHDYIKTDKNYACKVIRTAAEDNRPITAREMLLESRESVTLRRQVKSSEVDKLVMLMSPEEVLKQAFNWTALQAFLEKKKRALQLIEEADTEEGRQAQQVQLEKINTDMKRFMKRFDLSSQFMEDLEDVLPPQKAVTVKAALRGKVGEELLKEGDNPTKQLIRELGGFTEADIKLIGTDIKAISAIELEKQSETGLQWSTMSSSMLQRDVAAADFLTKGWERHERIPAMGGVLNERDLEAEKETLVGGLVSAEAQLTVAREKFEARKASLDKKLAQVINALMQAVFFTLTMASGVGAAAGIVQLAWALSSTFIQTSISQTLSMVTSGDRSGGAMEKAEDFFFTALADQAGAVTGLIGTNLAFALDVKALGVLSQGKAADGTPLLSNWENILRTPFFKTANGILRSTFADIGKNFVNNLANEKDSMFKDPIGDLTAWGKKTIMSLPRRYLKALVMTTASTAVGALAKELEWDFLKFHNPDAAGSNRYTANNEDRDFASSDARLGFFTTDASNFEEWYNGWGMFDASPKFGGNAAWQGGDDPWTGFLDVFSSAAKNLQDPKVLTALANSVVWGTMDGSTMGIKQQLGSLVDESIDSFTAYSGQPIDKATRATLKQQMETALDDSLQQQQAELKTALEKGYGTNLTEEQIAKLQADEYTPHEVMNLWNEIDWIGDGEDPENNLEFFNKVAKVLSLSEEQIKLYRREEACVAFNNVNDFVQHYNNNKENYDRVLNDEAFVTTYVEQRSNEGTHPKQVQYTIRFDGEDLVNEKDLDGDLNNIYAEWKKLQEMDAQAMQLIF